MISHVPFGVCIIEEIKNEYISSMAVFTIMCGEMTDDTEWLKQWWHFTSNMVIFCWAAIVQPWKTYLQFFSLPFINTICFIQLYMDALNLDSTNWASEQVYSGG